MGCVALTAASNLVDDALGFFSFYSIFFLAIPTMSAVVFLAVKLVGVLAAVLFTLQSFRRQHEQGMKIWTAFWITLILEFFVLGIIDAIFGFIPYYTILQICRFVVVWMLISQAAGDHFVAAFKKVGLLSE